MESRLNAPPSLQAVRDELAAREPLFHRPEFGVTRADFEAMTASDFSEVGASGRRYSREFVLDTLEKRGAVSMPEDWRAHDFDCRRLAPDTYLLTYTLEQGERISRRSTIWQQSDGVWRALFHQGTLAAAPGDRGIETLTN